MARECEGHGDVYCSDCGATLAAAERDLAEARRERDEAEARAEKAERDVVGLNEDMVRVRTERDDALAKLTAHDDLFRDYQIEGDECLRDVVERLARAAATRMLELRECRAKLAALEALAHDESGLDDHHPSWSTEWAIKEMAQRWAGASTEAEHAQARLASAERVVEASRLLLRMWPHCATCVIVGPPGGPATILKEPTEESCICDPDAKAYRRALRAYDSSGSSEPCLQGESAMPGMPARAGEQSRVGETTSGDTRPPASAGTTPCRGCGQPLAHDYASQRIADGCPCNSRRGINHGLVPTHVCTCSECDPAQTGAVRSEPAYGHVSKADECQLDEPRPEVDRCKHCRAADCSYPDHGNGDARDPQAPATLAWCPQCGRNPRVDDDGCCAACGATCGRLPGYATRADLDALHTLPDYWPNMRMNTLMHAEVAALLSALREEIAGAADRVRGRLDCADHDSCAFEWLANAIRKGGAK